LKKSFNDTLKLFLTGSFKLQFNSFSSISCDSKIGFKYLLLIKSSNMFPSLFNKTLSSTHLICKLFRFIFSSEFELPPLFNNLLLKYIVLFFELYADFVICLEFENIL
jgi:hypothetical protein